MCSEKWYIKKKNKKKHEFWSDYSATWAGYVNIALKMWNHAGASVLTEPPHLQWSTFLTKITGGRVDTVCHLLCFFFGWPKDVGEMNSSLLLGLWSTLFITAKPRGRKVICQTELSVSAHSSNWPAWYKYPRLNSPNENALFKGD